MEMQRHQADQEPLCPQNKYEIALLWGQLGMQPQRFSFTIVFKGASVINIFSPRQGVKWSMQVMTCMTGWAMFKGRTKAIFGDVFEAVGLETERRLAVKVTELEKMRLQAQPAVWASLMLAIDASFPVRVCEIF